MAGNRSAAQNFILKYIDKIAPGGENKAIYEAFFKEMSDKDFEQFINDLESGKRFLTVTAPNFRKNGLSVERNFEIADELGHNFFQRLWIGAKGDCPAYLTPIPYLVVDLPFRRASQLLKKKLKVPEHSRTVDALSGQPTGESKGAKISYPELQLLAAMDMDNSIKELIKYRGGDVKGGNALKAMLSKYGTANQATLGQYASGVESTMTLKVLLLSMNLKSTL